MEKTKFPKQINSEADVEQFYRHCVEVVGIGFHCDTNFAEYLQFSFDVGFSIQMFNDLIVEEYESFNLQCFGFCAANGFDVYSICLDVMSKVVEEIQLDLTI